MKEICPRNGILDDAPRIIIEGLVAAFFLGVMVGVAIALIAPIFKVSP